VLEVSMLSCVWKADVVGVAKKVVGVLNAAGGWV